MNTRTKLPTSGVWSQMLNILTVNRLHPMLGEQTQYSSDIYRGCIIYFTLHRFQDLELVELYVATDVVALI